MIATIAARRCTCYSAVRHLAIVGATPLPQLTEQGRQRIDELAQRYAVSTDAVMTLLHALVNSNGTMAQFNHAELGGGGQWMLGSKAASLLFSTSVADSYLVISNWSRSTSIRADRSLVLSNSSSSRLRSSVASTMFCLHMFKPVPFPAPYSRRPGRDGLDASLHRLEWVRFAKSGAFVLLLSYR